MNDQRLAVVKNLDQECLVKGFGQLDDFLQAFFRTGVSMIKTDFFLIVVKKRRKVRER